jgi:hypothetical protein
MKRALDIMKIKPDYDKHGKDFMRILSTQQAVIASVLSTTARVESAKLRSKGEDGMDRVLAAMEEARRAQLMN